MTSTRLLLLCALVAGPVPVAAQVRVEGMARAVPTLTNASPRPGGGSLTETRVLQPIAMGMLSVGQPWRLRGTLDLEGLTMPDGELAPGTWGEGYVDRRHPHTYVHELLAWNRDLFGTGTRGWAVSLTAGKGFAPFGTDDPMVRPFVRYPVNHHWSQILERAMVATGVRVGPVALEAALFNGDEPEKPSQWPNWERFGDSWSARGFVWPARGLELQASYADVASPEHRPGAGLEQYKLNASARWERTIGTVRTYALAEWARTEEAGGTFEYHSVLAEAAAGAGRHRVSYRFERTERPEEERLFEDPFRSIRPHLDDNIVGQTRWTLHTVNYTVRFDVAGGSLAVSPFVEVTLGNIAKVGDALFDPASFYGSTDVGTLSVGVRMDLGGTMHRMGRYGVIDADAVAGTAAGRDHH
ncbi:MAG: hypothetical protein ACJ8B6_05800 [Gemmatimonadales bacterium]